MTRAASIWADVVAELPVGMLLTDEHCTVLAHNARAAELLGLTSAQLRTASAPAHWRACAENGARLPSPAELLDQLCRTGAATALAIRVGAEQRQTRLWAKY